MSAKITVAELLIELGLDAKDAEKTVDRVNARLGKTKKAGEQAGKGLDKSAKSLERWKVVGEGAAKVANVLVAGLTAAGGVVLALGKKVLDTGKTFESLRAQLKTATGSAEDAGRAFDFIRGFAAKTPFQVEQVTEAFIKLKNFGLDPSERALTSYGDTASSMGKSLDQMVEAVADATTGEFERLKAFGIKSSKEGDNISFTFRGIRTTVRNNSKEIQEFLVGLGENNFSGAMGEQMLTLNGLVSNLKDAVAEFFLSVAELGPLEEFKGLITDIRDAAGDKKGLAKTLAKTLVTAIKAVRRLLKGDFIETLKKAAGVLEFVIENFDIFIGLIGGAKTIQAFSAAAQGFRVMGIAANASLGPIGLVMAAMIALIPIALKAGNAIGDALGHTSTNTVKSRSDLGKPAVVSEAGLGAEGERKSVKLMAEEKKLLEAQTGGASKARLRVLRDNVSRASLDLERTQERAQKIVDEKRVAEETERKKSEGIARLDAGEQAEFGEFDAQIEGVAEALGITEEGKVTDRQQSRLDAAIAELAVSGDLKKARKAAGLDKKKGRGKGQKKEDGKKVTSPTSVSEFFGAAARGDLGPIAAKTPGTKEIEPTVAVDITNNHFTFDVTQKITGVSDPVKAGMESGKAIRDFFQGKISVAGQSVQTNLKR